MRFTTLALLIIASGAPNAAAFTRPTSSSHQIVIPRNSRSSRIARFSTPPAADEVEKLRAAAAKAREEANKLAKELGKDIETPAEKAAKIAANKYSKEELLDALSVVPFEGGDVVKQSNDLNKLREDGQLSLYKTANLRTYPVSLQMLESRTALTTDSLGFGESEVSLDDFKYATLGVTLGSGFLGILSLALLPPNIGATLCYLFAVIPIIFLGIGSTAPGAIAEVIARVRDGNKDEAAQVALEDRVARHEAAHFMCGYLCGLPIVGYNVLQDSGVPSVEFSTGSNQQSFTNEQVASLSITAMSGLVAEAMEYDNVKGAENDLLELEQIFRRSKEFIGAQQQQDLTRWGALTAHQLLTANRGKLEELVTAFKEQKKVAECVSILEC